MDIDRAIAIIDEATSKLSADRQSHLLIAQALETIRKALPKETPPKSS